MTALTVLADSDTYVRNGVSEPGLTAQQWADKFTALGGKRCRVRASWQINHPGKVAVEVHGSDEAVAYVVACCRG
jgi:hypothetical protein